RSTSGEVRPWNGIVLRMYACWPAARCGSPAAARAARSSRTSAASYPIVRGPSDELGDLLAHVAPGPGGPGPVGVLGPVQPRTVQEAGQHLRPAGAVGLLRHVRVLL